MSDQFVIRCLRHQENAGHGLVSALVTETIESKDSWHVHLAGCPGGLTSIEAAEWAVKYGAWLNATENWSFIRGLLKDAGIFMPTGAYRNRPEGMPPQQLTPVMERRAVTNVPIQGAAADLYLAKAVQWGRMASKPELITSEQLERIKQDPIFQQTLKQFDAVFRQFKEAFPAIEEVLLTQSEDPNVILP